MTRPPLIWLPDALDHLEHAVLDTDVLRAAAVGAGEVTAVCSTSVRLCSLATPPGGRCADCDVHVTGDRTSARRDGFWVRLRPPWGRPGRGAPACGKS